MTLLALIKKEARVILRSRLLLLVLVLYPLVIVGIIGYAFSQPNQKVPVAVVNEDVDPVTDEPLEGFVTNPIDGTASSVKVSTADIIQNITEFADVTVTTSEEGARLLLTGQVQAVVHFQPNFVLNIVTYSGSAQLEITLDQSDPVRAKFMEVIIRGIVQEFQERIISKKVELVVDAINRAIPDVIDPPQRGEPLYPGFLEVRDRLEAIQDTHEDLSVDERVMLNESVEFLNTVINTMRRSNQIIRSIAEPLSLELKQEESGSLFIRDLIVPAALGLSIFWTGTLATSSLVVYERESPAYTRLRLTPANAWSIYGSKIALTVGIILIQSAVILLVARTAWDPPTRIDNFALAAVVILLSTFASMGLGMFLAGISRDVNGTVLLSVLATFPMLFLSGLFFPTTFMPRGAQILADFFPLTHTVAGLRGAMLRGFSFEVAQTQLLALLAFGVVLTTAGVLLSKRLELKR